MVPVVPFLNQRLLRHGGALSTTPPSMPLADIGSRGPMATAVHSDSRRNEGTGQRGRRAGGGRGRRARPALQSARGGARTASWVAPTKGQPIRCNWRDSTGIEAVQRFSSLPGRLHHCDRLAGR